MRPYRRPRPSAIKQSLLLPQSCWGPAGLGGEQCESTVWGARAAAHTAGGWVLSPRGTPTLPIAAPCHLRPRLLGHTWVNPVPPHSVLSPPVPSHHRSPPLGSPGGAHGPPEPQHLSWPCSHHRTPWSSALSPVPWVGARGPHPAALQGPELGPATGSLCEHPVRPRSCLRCCRHAQDPGPWPQTQPRGPRAGTEPRHTVLGPAAASRRGWEQSRAARPALTQPSGEGEHPARPEAQEPTHRSLHVPPHVK